MRICDDIYGVLLHAFHQLSVGVLRPFSKLGWFTYRIGQLLGPKYAAAIWVYVAISVVVLKVVMPGANYSCIHDRPERLTSVL